MKLILTCAGYGIIYLGANSLDIKDYLIVMAGALVLYLGGGW